MAEMPHVYLSTACLHGQHGYCRAPTVTRDGEWETVGPSYVSQRDEPKAPARCKFCPAECVCGCHGAVVVGGPADRWKVGPVGRTLYRDGELVGEVETPEIAAEIVETMNRVGRLLAEVWRACGCDPAAGVECRQHMTMITDGSRRESGRERSPACTCPLVDIGSTYHDYVRGRPDGCPFHDKRTEAQCPACDAMVPGAPVDGEYRLGKHDSASTGRMCRGSGGPS
jgi:hypothetical protein